MPLDKTGSRPYILYIMSDDHAFHAISAYTKHMEWRPVINETALTMLNGHNGGC
jgi:hypothetical protein